MTESVYAQNRVARVERSAQKTVRKLSSGVRISSAADAAADLGISEKMRAHIKSARAAERNIHDGISMLNTVDGGLDEINDKLDRMRELAVASSTEVLSGTERAYLNDEFRVLIRDIDRVAETSSSIALAIIDRTRRQLTQEINLASRSASLRIFSTDGASPGRGHCQGLVMPLT